MAAVLSPHFIDLVQDSLLKSYWTKKALRTFLRRSHIAETFLSQLSNDETKRDDASSLVALNLDATVLHRAARAASLLEHSGKFL
jgi:hypothetical protein